jgi:hypothetical protein
MNHEIPYLGRAAIASGSQKRNTSAGEKDADGKNFTAGLAHRQRTWGTIARDRVPIWESSEILTQEHKRESCAREAGAYWRPAGQRSFARVPIIL